MKRAEKEQAIQLRQGGQSIKEIARALGVSKSSVSTWVRHIVLSQEHLNGLIQRVRRNGATISSARAMSYRLIDERERRQGYELAETDATFRLICGMYWGEGAKTNNLFHIANADPRFISVVCSWLNAVGVDPTSVQFKFQFHRANGFSETDVVGHWVEEVPYLSKCVLRKCRCVEATRPSQPKLVGKCPYGTCTLYVRKSRKLFNLVYGGIEYISAKLAGD